MMTGIELIAAERKRQVEVEGFTNDDIFQPHGELARAAVCYALPPKDRVYHVGIGREQWKIPALWPWSITWWKPTPDDRVRELTKAGALIAAEIDRLLAKEQENGQN